MLLTGIITPHTSIYLSMGGYSPTSTHLPPQLASLSGLLRQRYHLVEQILHIRSLVIWCCVEDLCQGLLRYHTWPVIVIVIIVAHNDVSSIPFKFVITTLSIV